MNDPKRTGVVLVVDDDRVVAELSAEILRGAGHEVHVAHDAATAIELAGETEVDVVLTDVVLGSVDGVDLAEAIALLRPSARVVFMSGYGSQTRGPAANDPVLGKPFSAEALRGRVAEALSS